MSSVNPWATKQQILFDLIKGEGEYETCSQGKILEYVKELMEHSIPESMCDQLLDTISKKLNLGPVRGENFKKLNSSEWCENIHRRLWNLNQNNAFPLLILGNLKNSKLKKQTSSNDLLRNFLKKEIFITVGRNPVRDETEIILEFLNELEKVPITVMNIFHIHEHIDVQGTKADAADEIITSEAGHVSSINRSRGGKLQMFTSFFLQDSVQKIISEVILGEVLTITTEKGPKGPRSNILSSDSSGRYFKRVLGHNYVLRKEITCNILNKDSFSMQIVSSYPIINFYQYEENRKEILLYTKKTRGKKADILEDKRITKLELLKSCKQGLLDSRMVKAEKLISVWKRLPQLNKKRLIDIAGAIFGMKVKGIVVAVPDDERFFRRLERNQSAGTQTPKKRFVLGSEDFSLTDEVKGVVLRSINSAHSRSASAEQSFARMGIKELKRLLAEAKQSCTSDPVERAKIRSRRSEIQKVLNEKEEMRNKDKLKTRQAKQMGKKGNPKRNGKKK